MLPKCGHAVSGACTVVGRLFPQRVLCLAETSESNATRLRPMLARHFQKDLNTENPFGTGGVRLLWGCSLRALLCVSLCFLGACWSVVYDRTRDVKNLPLFQLQASFTKTAEAMILVPYPTLLKPSQAAAQKQLEPTNKLFVQSATYFQLI